MSARDDFAFANDVRAAMEDTRSDGAWFPLLAIAAMIVAAVTWASFAVLEEVTTGQGKVIPSTQLQVVQTLEGGIVRAIAVKEGDIVEAGQILIEVDDTGLASKLGEVQSRRTTTEAEIIRLTAEARGDRELVFPDVLRQVAPRAVEAQEEAFRARLAQLDDEREILKQQLVQRRQELLELEANREKLRSTLVPLDREVELTRRLSDRKVIPEVDLLRLERQRADIAGELAVIEAALPRAESAISESETRIAAVEAKFRSEARERLARVVGDLSVLEKTEIGAADLVNRTELKAPVRGVVNKVNVSTIGAVVQPAVDIVEIVPLDDALQIEARIRPQDVAFIRPGQEASVKLTAYDYTVYGDLTGNVERISADTSVDERGEAYYRVIVRTEQAMLERYGEELPILPGMVATVDIQTGEKTVLDYVLKPVLKVREEALRER